MIKALIIDDEPLARSLLMEYLEPYDAIKVIAECGDGFEGLKAIQSHHPDLIFLDIQMPKITGFEMLELVENPPGVIFTTAFDEYAIKAFEADAIDYLLKPFSKERFDKAIQKWMAQFNNGTLGKENLFIDPSASSRPEDSKRIVVKTNNGIKIIPVSEIIYIEAYDDYVKIFTKEGMFLKKKTMAHYENALGDFNFVRVHRSYIVAVNQITRIEQPEKEAHVALLKTGIRIPLSRQGYGKLKGVLGV